MTSASSMQNNALAQNNSIARWFPVLYLLLLFTDILVLSFPEWRVYREWSKPLILFSLMLFYLFQRFPLRQSKDRLMMLALFGSFLGDGFLNYEGYFIQGLLSFFTAHIFYILVFFRPSRWKKMMHPLITPLILIFTILVFRQINSGLGQLKPYVIAYMLILVVMALTMLSRKGSCSSRSYTLGVAGGLLFLISDAVLALQKFDAPFFMGDQLVMFTYGMAQILLVYAALSSFSPGDSSTRNEDSSQ